MSKKQTIRDDFEDAGAVTGGEYTEARQTYDLFSKPGIYSTEEFNRTLRFCKAALGAQFLEQTPMTKAGATALAGEFVKFIHTIARQAAMHPEIAGATGGVSADNASNVASRAKTLLVHSSEVSKAVFETEVGRNTLGVVSASLASAVSGKYNVMDPQGGITFEAVATAAPVQVQFYPAIILDIANTIQAAYDKLGLDPIFIDAMAPIDDMVVATGRRSFNYGAMNGPCGQYQGVVPILKDALVRGLDETFFRRDKRSFARSARPPRIDDVLILSVQAMRSVLVSLIEMSVALGHVKRTTEENKTSPTAPKKSVYTIRDDSPFRDLIDAICEHRKYYSQAFVKDLATYAAATNRKASEIDIQELVDTPIFWANLEVHAKAAGKKFGTYVIRSSAIIVELETRARTGDYNNVPFIEGPKPDSLKAGVPSLVFFFKHPEEIRLCSEILKDKSQSLESKNLKKATAKYITDLTAANGPMSREDHPSAAARLAGIVGNALKCSLLIFVARQCSDSMVKASVSDAIVSDAPK